MLMSKRHELLEEDDPRCVLHAWHGEFFIGGWPTNDPEALTAAVVDELHYVNVADTTGIEIVEVSPPQTPKNDREKLLKQLPSPAPSRRLLKWKMTQNSPCG